MGFGDTAYTIIMLGFFALIAVSLVYEKKSRISPTPVLPSVRKVALGMIPDNFLPMGHYNICDLGCGWGGFLSSLSKRFLCAKLTGYEISPFPYLFSKIRAFLFMKNVCIVRKNFFIEDISAANLVFCYLSPYHMSQLKPQFETMSANTWIVSCSFPITGWKADRTEIIKGVFVDIPVYRYSVGDNICPNLGAVQ